MTSFALGFMLLSMASVSVLVVYCYARILKDNKGFHPDGESADPEA